MIVALFGGTGFVGSYLVDALIDAGHQLSLLVRPGSEHRLRHTELCRVTIGDLSSDSAIAATLDDCDAVVFSVGILRESSTVTFEAVQYEALAKVARLAKKQQISRFLLMSANGVKQPGTPYQETKLRAERCIRNMGFEYTIFRPSVIFGNPRGAMEIATQLCCDLVKQPFPAVRFSDWKLSRDRILMSPAHVEDVANAFVAALQDPTAAGKVYAIGGPEVLSWSQMIRRVAQAVGVRKTILPVPIGLMWIAAAVLDRFSFFPVTRDQLTMLEEGNRADPAHLADLIGREPLSFDVANLSYLAT